MFLQASLMTEDILFAKRRCAAVIQFVCNLIKFYQRKFEQLALQLNKQLKNAQIYKDEIRVKGFFTS